MSELNIDADLQAMLDAARTQREARESRTPVVRAIPFAAGRPLSPPADAPASLRQIIPLDRAPAGTYSPEAT